LVTRYALIAPITRTVRNWPFEVLLGPGLRIAGAVLTDQTRTVDFEARHAKFLGKAPPELTREVLARLASIMEE
jgi:mRNA interferase MazF